jgi:hypothetical protein
MGEVAHCPCYDDVMGLCLEKNGGYMIYIYMYTYIDR